MGSRFLVTPALGEMESVRNSGSIAINPNSSPTFVIPPLEPRTELFRPFLTKRKARFLKRQTISRTPTLSSLILTARSYDILMIPSLLYIIAPEPGDSEFGFCIRKIQAINHRGVKDTYLPSKGAHCVSMITVTAA